MNKRLLISLVVIAGVLLIATLVVTLLALRQRSSTTNQTNTTTSVTTTSNTSSSTSASSNTSPTTNTAISAGTGSVSATDRTSIISLAQSFTERYGSFSSDSGYANIEALRSFMTTAMNSQADKISSQSRQTSAEFYGISTQVTNVKLTDYVTGATGATVEVQTRRTETPGLQDPESFSQSARLQLKLIDNVWLVDSFKWL